MSELLSDYEYFYPEAAVAQAPLAERDDSRMMVLNRGNGTWAHRAFHDFPELLRPGDLLILNNTSVFPCRFFCRKSSGGKVEVFFLRPDPAGLGWEVLFSPTRGLAEGMVLPVISRITGAESGATLEVVSLTPDAFRARWHSDLSEAEFFSQFGEMPLPPYIRREAPRAEDRHRYQTLFAEHSGAVAAPTAGLHFSGKTFAALAARGVETAFVTLHVGMGTFLPVKTERVTEHRMHAEYFQIPNETLQALGACRERGGRVIAVGTTSLRCLESWSRLGQAKGWTDLFIRPGYQFKAVDALLTNFHQPKSTLLMLVSALAGRERVLAAYAEAIQAGYRLFSYGDCMLILE